MRRQFLVRLGLLYSFACLSQAGFAQQNSIVGPDGRGPSPLAPRPPQPTLEDQLRRKKKLEEDTRGLPDQPATPTDELLDPKDKAQIAAMQGTPLPEEYKPRFRMSLGLAKAQAKKIAGAMDTYRFEPGAIWETAFRLTDPNSTFSFWTGLRLAAWSATAQSSTSFARFATQYVGPLFAFEWWGTPRSTLAFGMAGVSRQTDPLFTGSSDTTATRKFGLDGPGLWVSYAAGFRISKNFEWEAKIGAQSSASYVLTYLSLGVSLWTD